MINFFGKTVKKYREKKRLTQWDVARYLKHSSSQYVSNLERGMCYASVEMAMKLGEYLGIPKAAIFNDLQDESDAILREKFR